MRCLWMFSRITMESSTRIPTHSVRPVRESMLKEKPAKYIIRKVDMIEVGMASITVNTERHSRKKNIRTTPVIRTPSRSVRLVSVSESLMNSALFKATTRLKSFGNCFSICSSCFDNLSAVSTMLASLCF